MTPRAERRQPKRRRFVIPLITVLLWIFVLGPLGSFSGRLAEVQENDNAGFLPGSAESTQVLELQGRFVEDDGTLPAILVFEGDAELTDAQLEAIEEDLDALGAVSAVTGEAQGPIVAEDGEAALAIVPLDAEFGEEISEAVTELREVLAEGAAVEAGLDAFVTGPAGSLGDFAEAFGEIDGLLLGVTLLVVLVILLVVYRSPVLPFVVLFAAVLALGAASAVVYVLADNDILDLNGQSQGILFILVIGAATDYSLLLVSRFREELRRYENKYDAIRASLKGTYEAILASGGTVVLGVLMFQLSDLSSIRGLGPVAAVGVIFAMLAGLTFLPACLALLGRGAFWPFRPAYGSAPTEVRGVWGKVARLVGRRFRIVWIATAAVLLGLAALAPTFKAEGIAQSDFFLTEVPSAAGQEALERHFPAGLGSETIIITQAVDLEDVLETTLATEGVAEAFPVLAGPPPGAEGAAPGAEGAAPGTEGAAPGTEGAAPGAEGAPPGVEGAPPVLPLVVDGLVEIRVVLDDPADSDAAEETIQRLRIELNAASDYALVGGSTAIQVDTQAASQRDLRVIIPAVLLVILLVLMALLRSIAAPVLLVATVVLSFGTTLGLGALVFFGLLDQPGADPSVPLFAFVFLAALGIDYNIFLMTRAREEALTHGTRPGVLKALAVTGGVITSAGIVLAATFSALVVLPLLFLFQIAFLVAAGVLIDTFVVRSLLVPALVMEIGPKVWWPSKLAHRADDETELRRALHLDDTVDGPAGDGPSGDGTPDEAVPAGAR
jgi:RND superfamily putative drug exporter